MRNRVRTTCTRDCPDSCGIVATVEDGRIVRHVGDPEHGVTRGFLCRRGHRYLRRFYSPDRILHPLRRTPGGWRRVTWDDALDLAAEKLAHYRDTLGPLSVVAVSYSGLKGLVSRTLWRLFWAHFGGATFTEGGLSVEAAFAAQQQDFGAPCTHSPEDLANSAAVVIWGKNIVVTRPHAWPFLTAARKMGAVVHVVDPVRCSTARRADRHYQLRPGSDALLAMGVGRLLIERDAVDREFVDRYCRGFDGYRRLVGSYELEDVAEATDLTRDQIEELAELYATTKPLATMAGLGPCYWRRGGSTVRLIDAADLPDEPVVRTHPDTASGLGLEEGDLVRVASSVGRVRARLAYDETVRRDVALLNPAAWRGDLQGVNQLREATLADLGNAAAMHETLVTLEPAVERAG